MDLIINGILYVTVGITALVVLGLAVFGGLCIWAFSDLGERGGWR